MQCFKKFKDTAQAVKSLQAIVDGDLPEDLNKFLKKNIVSKDIKDTLLCKLNKYIYSIIFYYIGYESKIAKTIQSTLGIEAEANSKYLEVFRGIRSQITNLISGNYNKNLKFNLDNFLRLITLNN